VVEGGPGSTPASHFKSASHIPTREDSPQEAAKRKSTVNFKRKKSKPPRQSRVVEGLGSLEASPAPGRDGA
jgi:hypothetical protein